MTKRQIIFQKLATATLMSACMSFVMVIINLGFVSGLFLIFLRRWPIGFAVALPLSFILPPLVQKLIKVLKI